MTATQTDKSSNKYALNLNEKMVNSLIVKVEAAIIAEKQKQSLLDNDLKAAKEMYEAVKSQYDAFQAVIDDEQDVLNALVRFKTHPAANKSIQVFQRISNTHQKVKKSTKLIYWTKESEKYLQKVNQFMTPLELIKELNATVPAIIDRKYDIKILKVRANTLWDCAKKKLSGLNVYRTSDKMYIGLNKWFDAAGNLKPEYVKQFMFNSEADYVQFRG